MQRTNYLSCGAPCDFAIRAILAGKKPEKVRFAWEEEMTKAAVERVSLRAAL